MTVLRLVDQGKIEVTPKTGRATRSSMKAMSFGDGDFYDWQPKKNSWDQEIAPIKAFAWPLLVQAGKLATVHGSRLALSKSGQKALGAPPVETLKQLWQTWKKSRLLDEFNRVEAIRGQKGKGRRSLTAVPARRTVIVEALGECPLDKWVSFDDFSTFMQATGREFAVAHDLWALYLEERQYGNFGFEGYGGWNVVQGRYVLCFLFEYAATLGLIDIAYENPEGARPDYTEQWGADELVFLSRYDGLKYFRLNPLGAYCLDLASAYVPGETLPSASISVLPSLQVNIAGLLVPDELFLLEAFAEKESDTVWRLSHEKAVAAIERSTPIERLRKFLQTRDQQPLPETVEGFLIAAEAGAKACIHRGAAVLIECATDDIAQLLSTSPQTKHLCIRAGTKNLVVKAELEADFKKGLRRLGYGMT